MTFEAKDLQGETVRQRCIPLDAPAEWREALQGIQHAFAHTWENCYAMHLTTGFETYLYCFETEGARIVCPIAEREFKGYTDIVTPYGFSGFVGSGDCPQFARYWSIFVKQQGYICGYIGLNPVFKNSSYYDPHETYAYNEIYVLDLTLEVDELFHNLSSNRQRQLRRWKKSGPAMISDKALLSEFFMNNYADFFQRKQAATVYNFSEATLSYVLGLENVYVVGTGAAEEIEAVTVFAYTPHISDFLFNVSLPGGQRHSAALLWHGLNYFKSLRVPFLNLGGGVHKDDGVAQFKQRFGSKSLSLRSLKQVYRPEIYEALCRREGADPEDMTGYFPAYRNSRSPLHVMNEA